ncbi:sugar O-acetyltransferase [Secundilactobacillus yichangensis]|uniref:sugar O-acetyltransferase n=1 Tax=Secundilactobacillus yichangensis TaxID=2799580 RepID=UPI001942E609|nr:sugar O-acetyltransferase [Secundilactobacillus yichangensis]
MNLEEKFAYMATGQPYDDLDPKLMKVRENATTMTQRLNAITDPEKRNALFTQLIGHAGKAPFVEPNFRCEFGRNIRVGDHFYANYDCVMLDGAPINIGTHVLFGPKVGLYTSNHLFDPVERRTGGCAAQPITIGDDVWLAANVTVLPGVSIGSNVIVGAGSVVTSDIPSNVIAVGNPCHVLREITAADRTGFNGQDFSAGS